MPFPTLSRFAFAGAALVAAFLSTPGKATEGSCKLQKIASLTVELWGTTPMIPVSINGTQAYFIADTGSNLTMMFSSTVSRLGLELDNFDRRRIRTTGIGGGAGEVHATQIGEFKIGEATIRDFQMMVGGDLHGADARVAGLLGEDFFRDYDVEFDLRDRRINLFHAKNCDDHPLAYWTSDYGVLPFETGRSGAMILVPVQINDQPVSALLDTGSGISFMTIEAAGRAGVTTETAGVEQVSGLSGVGQNKVSNWVAPFHSFTIAEETIQNVKMRFADMTNLHWRSYGYLKAQNRIDDKNIGYQGITVMNTDMVLGDDFVSAHRVMISHSQHKIYFSYLGGPIFKPHQVLPAEEAGSPAPGPQ